jgi:hypothetical protein
MASSLADQGTLADLSGKFSGRIPVRIHFLDNSSKLFLSEPSTTVRDLVTQCLEKYGVKDIAFVLPYYALYESRNGGAIDDALAMETKVQEAIQTWSEAGVAKTAKFLFMIRLYLPSISGLEPRDVVAARLQLSKEDLSTSQYLAEAQVIDSNALHLQFIQAVYHVITGRYPTAPDEALTLGAVHFLLKFGRFQPEKHKAGFLGSRIFEFVPIKHLKGSGKSGMTASATADWERKLLEEAQRISEELVDSSASLSVGAGGSSEDTDEVSNGANLLFHLHGSAGSAQQRYLDLVYRMEPVFGATFFKCSQKSVSTLPETLQIAIYSDGLHLCDKNKKHLRSFYIEDIFRWGFKPAVMFYFEVSPDNEYGTGTLEFETSEGKIMSDLLTDYALSFLKEREREEERSAHAPAGKRAPTKNHTTFHGDSTHSSRKTNVNFRLTEKEAAVLIQARWRGFSLRNEWAREDAAILLQSVYRGYKARVLISKIIEQMLQEGQL